ncbi:MAG TPA: response regulator transcription factor [Mycobacteriales bacterium]|nr:response regulator transcription factor [Mycobacteriales bacterium]
METVKVLVVEDVPELSRLLDITFELDGRFVTVGNATSGGVALDLAAREHPDAIVLDLAIDGVDGISILPSLRAIVPDARIIIFTGHDEPRLRDRAMQAGADAWVVKGGDLSDLLNQLGSTLEVTEPS